MSDPIAYFITFRTYGTWLHGDARGSTDGDHNMYGTPQLHPHAGRERSAHLRLAQPSVTLSHSARNAVAMVVQQVCDHHDWILHASNVRSNHVHVVVSAPRSPEHVMLAFKSWGTRRLRQLGLAQKDTKVWSRHGSTKYIWKPNQLAEACRYVMEAQGDDDGPARMTSAVDG